MHSITDILQWISAISGNTVLLLLLVAVFYRKLFRRLPFVVIYVVFTALRAALLDYSYYGTIASEHRYFFFYFYWGTAFVLSFLRLAIILEICHSVLRSYPAIKTLAWRIVAFLGVALFSWTVYSSMKQIAVAQAFILTGQQRTDLSMATLLLVIMGIGGYYRIHIPQLYRLILIGSCIYSAEQVVGSEIGRHIHNPGFSVFDFAERYSITLMLGIWAWAVWRWGDAPAEPPNLVEQKVYDELSPQIHDRLKDLNDKLADLTGRRS